MTKPRLALLGWYAKSNFGDDFMAAMLPTALSPHGEAEVSVYSDDSAPGVINGLEEPGYLDCDAIVIGGGGIFSPDFWAFREGGLEKILATGKPVFCLNVNVYPDTFYDPVFAHRLRLLGAVWWVRDTTSVALLAENGIEANHLPDISFRQGVVPRREAARNARPRVLCVFLNHHAFHSYFHPENMIAWLRANQNARVIAQHLDWMASFGWQIHIVAAQTAAQGDDCVPGGLVFGLCQNRRRISWDKRAHSWPEIIEILRNSDMVFSQRYHVSTITLASGVPLVDITHHIKNAGFLRDIGLPDLSVPMASLSHELLIEVTCRAEHRDYACVDSYLLEAHRRWEEFDKTWAGFLRDHLETKKL